MTEAAPSGAINQSAMLLELGELARRHKLVPFLGAGCSLGHVSVDWDALTEEMAAQIGVPYSGSNPAIAQQYVDTKGRPALMDLLAKDLRKTEFKDENGTAPLAVMSLGVGVVYTTNQDNVFELCAEKYGRRFRPIVRLSDLAESAPGDRLLIKYHGDLPVADSVVFTNSDYDDRIREVDHFLNIRMRSDLLAKSFLFIGYSFRDRNVRQIFSELSAAFRGRLPRSYLLAFRYTAELEDLGREFGIKIVDPRRECPDAMSDKEAFDLFLARLTDVTLGLKTRDQIEDMFHPRVPSTVRVVTRYELAALATKVSDPTVTVDDAIQMFRALLDASRVPLDHQVEVVQVFRSLAQRSAAAAHSHELTSALFNLSLAPEHLFECWALCKTTARYRGSDLFDVARRPIAKELPEQFRPIAAARAIELIREWGQTVNEPFRHHLDGWLRHVDEVPAEFRPYVKEAVDWAWKGEKQLSHPLRQSRWRPLGDHPPSFQQLNAETLAMLPKTFKRPFEE